ncbi:hypothetical protein [Methylobacterium sp. CM6247]
MRLFHGGAGGGVDASAVWRHRGAMARRGHYRLRGIVGRSGANLLGLPASAMA